MVDAARLVLPEDEFAARALWIRTRRRYVELVGDRMDLELAETFYNSVTRRLFEIVGLDTELEFLWLGPTALPADDGTRGEYRAFPVEEALVDCVREIFEHSPLADHFADLEGDAERVAARVAVHLDEIWDGALDAIDVLRPIFYRNKGAYLVGRLRWLNRVSPIVIHSPTRSGASGSTPSCSPRPMPAASSATPGRTSTCCAGARPPSSAS